MSISAYDAQHVPFATLPGMRMRTLRIGSAGKIFSFTGWKIGWLTGPAALIDVVAKTHQFLTFAIPGALQKGAHGLTQVMDFPSRCGRASSANRDFLGEGLARLGSKCCPARAPGFLWRVFRA